MSDELDDFLGDGVATAVDDGERTEFVNTAEWFANGQADQIADATETAADYREQMEEHFEDETETDEPESEEEIDEEDDDDASDDDERGAEDEQLSADDGLRLNEDYADDDVERDGPLTQNAKAKVLEPLPPGAGVARPGKKIWAGWGIGWVYEDTGTSD